jgi:hypothetical protein
MGTLEKEVTHDQAFEQPETPRSAGITTTLPDDADRREAGLKMWDRGMARLHGRSQIG